MSRYVSFAVLLAVIAFFTVVFFRILSGFLIPLFLAALLVVIFSPLHDWMLGFFKGRKKLAALLTTLSVLLVVLIPIGMLLTMAVFEGKEVITWLGGTNIQNRARELRTNVGLDFPIADELRAIEETIAEMREHRTFEDLEYHQELWYVFKQNAKSFPENYRWLTDPNWEENSAALAKNQRDAQQRQRTLWNSMVENRKLAEQLAYEIKSPPGVDFNDDPPNKMEQLPPDNDVNGDDPAVDTDQLPADDEVQNETQENIPRSRSAQLSDYHTLISDTLSNLIKLKNDLAGGRPWVNLKMMVNPDEDQLAMYSHSAVDFLEGRLLSFGGATTAYAGKLVFGCLIMIIALYFFLLDGPNMIEAIQGLSPLDDEHEKELVSEFSRVSRAVVVATLLSALVQGLLAGIGFYFCGFESIFLLTMLTTALALVPFVGAAAVWVPACLYLYFVQNDMVSAIGLAVYGVAVISMADNIIKPMVLHGQSNIHPLVALLSVLGGVSALGPVGLLVGPMVVAFLQTLLKILQRELTSMEAPEVQT